MTQKLRSHYYELWFKTLVLSSVISALVFSKPLKMLLSVPSMGTVKKARASYIHDS